MRVDISGTIFLFIVLFVQAKMIRAFAFQQPFSAALRATRAMATATSGEEMLQLQTWAVVGDALNEKVRPNLFLPS